MQSDLEKGGGDPDAPHDHSQLPSNQRSQGESKFSDSSGPLFFMYSKAAEDEDKKMVERWQRDADGILIFTGLFSAAVAALLAMTVQTLQQDPQDTPSFYLGKIYEVLADQNVTRASTSPLAKPPPFSPPRYAVWVNSLWFLSLVISLSHALLTSSFYQWARRYIRLTQPVQATPEKRARMRAIFAKGAGRMKMSWAVEELWTLLHLSLFLFFVGLAIFLYHIDQEVFRCVISWVILFSIVYGFITLLPLIWHDCPYYTPLSMLIRALYASIPYATFRLLAYITSGDDDSDRAWRRFCNLRDRYRGQMSSATKAAEEMASSEHSPEIDVRILDWTISALGDDDSRESFFEAIPGFFNSNLVKLQRIFPEMLLKDFWVALDGFMSRTLSSKLVSESHKSRRVVICKDIMGIIPCPDDHKYTNLQPFLDPLVSIGQLQAMARWFNHQSDHVSYLARIRAAKNLARMQDSEHDSRWKAVAHHLCHLSPSSATLRRDVVLSGNNMILATLIDVSRQAISSRDWGLLRHITQFDINGTLPRLQHGFCELWNEAVQEAGKQGAHSPPVYILHGIRHHFIALHQGDNSRTKFSPSTEDFHEDLLKPSSYLPCDIHGHHPGSTAQPHVPNSPDASQLEETNAIADPPSPSHPMTPSNVEENSQTPTGTLLALLSGHTRPHLKDGLPSDAVYANLQDILSSATLSHPLEETTQRDIIASCAKPNARDILASPATPTLAPVSMSTPLVLDESLVSCNVGASTSTSDSLLPALPALGFATPSATPPSGDPLPPSAKIFALSTTTPSCPTSNVSLLHLRTRGLMNSGNMCFVNAVLQLLVHLPPLWNLFRELGELKRQLGIGEVPESGRGCATPLVDATVRFFEEFMPKEAPQQSPQQPEEAMRKPREDDQEKKMHNTADSIEPTYLYNAMKEKRQLKNMLDGQRHDAKEFFHHYIDALDEELPAPLASIRGHKWATAAPGIKEHEKSHLGQIGTGKRGFISVESPLTCIFGGRFRSPNQSDTRNNWRSLQLNIQLKKDDSVHTIEDALARMSQPQTDQPGSSEANVQTLIELFPPILVLHLNRLDYTTTTGIVKVKRIRFDPELEIPPNIMAPTAGRPVSERYKVFGVLYHHGRSPSNGHYTVSVLRRNGDGSGEDWLYINDKTMNLVRREEMFGGNDDEWVDDRCACMLFYCRTASARI